jgi:NAD(P)-dependent dehydrogenase (short-subunit alcohol dehydrogenase family)
MNGRVAAVLGVGPGLGAAVVRRFAGEGFAVAMMARREESLAEIRQDIEGDGGTALPVSPDAIAETYWQLHAQDRTAWTLEADLQPSVENF